MGVRQKLGSSDTQIVSGGVVLTDQENTNIRSGGAPVPSDLLVNVDPATMEGNGAINHPVSATGGGGGGGVELENADTPLAGGPFDTLNLVGITATDDGGGQATLTADGGGGVELSNAGVALAGGPFDTLNLLGITAANAGGGVADVSSMTAANVSATNVGPIANVQAVVIQRAIAANELKVGTSFRITAYGVTTGIAATQATIVARIGPVTLIGNIAVQLAGSGSTAEPNFKLDAVVTCISAGVGGTIAGSLLQDMGEQIGDDVAINTVPVVVNTTIANLLELCVNSGNAAKSYTFFNCAIEKIVA